MKCEDCGKTEEEVGRIALYSDNDYSEALLCLSCMNKRRTNSNDYYFNGKEDCS